MAHSNRELPCMHRSDLSHCQDDESNEQETLRTSDAAGASRFSITSHIAALDRDGNMPLANGRYEEALRCYTDVLEKLKIEPCLSILNIEYLQNHLLPHQESLAIRRSILGSNLDEIGIANTLNDIGTIYFNARELGKAIDVYKKAKTIMEQTLGMYHLDTATMYCNIGHARLLQGYKDRARIRYHEALKIRWQHLGKHHTTVSRLLKIVAKIDMEPLLSVSSNCTSDEDYIEPTIAHALKDLHQQLELDIAFVANVISQLQQDVLLAQREAGIANLNDLEGQMPLNTIEDDTLITDGMRRP